MKEIISFFAQATQCNMGEQSATLQLPLFKAFVVPQDHIAKTKWQISNSCMYEYMHPHTCTHAHMLQTTCPPSQNKNRFKKLGLHPHLPVSTPCYLRAQRTKMN